MFFLLLCGNAWGQVVIHLQPTSAEPPLLTLLQTGSGALALAVALGAWRMRARSAPIAVAYGAFTGGMIAALGPILALDADERAGLPLGAAAVLLVSLALAWYLRRATRHASSD